MLPNTYVKFSSQLLEGIAAANTAAMTATTPRDSIDDGGAVETDAVEPDEDHGDWKADGPETGDLSVEDSVTFTKTIHDEDVRRFAAASGDTNPLHLDEDFAEETRFDGRIAHGVLVSGLISAALARLPGDVVYLSQNLEFLAPVEIGDRVTAECTIAEDLGNDQYRLTTIITGDDVVVDGEAVVLID
jgi:acyl dehydratase